MFRFPHYAYGLFALVGLLLPTEAPAFWVGRSTDEQALLNAIQANPDEDTPHLAYADWLDEHGANGDKEKAKFIRANVRRSALNRNYGTLSSAEQNEVGTQWAIQNAQWASQREVWRRESGLPLQIATELPMGFRMGSSLRIGFHNGLPTQIFADSISPLREEGLAKFPFSEFHIHIRMQTLATLEGYAITSRIRKLRLSAGRLPLQSAPSFRKFFHSPKLEKLQTLDLLDLPPLLDTHWTHLQTAKPLANLRELTVNWNGREELADLLKKIAAGPWKNLRVLRVQLPHNLELPAPLDAALRSKIEGLPWELKVLELPVGQMTEAELATLFRLSKFRGSLEALHFTNWQVQEPNGLPGAIGQLEKLRQLHVVGRWLTDETVGRILRDAPLSLDEVVFDQLPRIQGEAPVYSQKAGPFDEIPDALLRNLRRLEINLRRVDNGSFESLFFKDDKPRVFPNLHRLSLKGEKARLPAWTKLLNADAFPALVDLLIGVDRSAEADNFKIARAFIAAARSRLSEVQLHGELDSPLSFVQPYVGLDEPLRSILHYHHDRVTELNNPLEGCAEMLANLWNTGWL